MVPERKPWELTPPELGAVIESIGLNHPMLAPGRAAHEATVSRAIATAAARKMGSWLAKEEYRRSRVQVAAYLLAEAGFEPWPGE